MLPQGEYKLSMMNCPARPLIGPPLCFLPNRTDKIRASHHFALLRKIFVDRLLNTSECTRTLFKDIGCEVWRNPSEPFSDLYISYLNLYQ